MVRGNWGSLSVGPIEGFTALVGKATSGTLERLDDFDRGLRYASNEGFVRLGFPRINVLP